MFIKYWIIMGFILLASVSSIFCSDKGKEEDITPQPNKEIPPEVKETPKEKNKLFSIGQGIASAVKKTVLHPIDTVKSVVTSNKTDNEKEREKETNPKEADESKPVKESGKLDFFGRDAVRTVGKAIGKVSDTVESAKNHVTNVTDKIISKIETTVGLDLTLGEGAKTESEFRKRVQAIYPGTKWCGDGNKARNDEDLGYFATTDACCREHDNCPLGIPASKIKFGLHNTGLFTRSHCDCDTKFYKCLKEANNLIAKKIGFTYFTILGPQCFKEDYPVSECKKKDGERCSEYLSDNSREKRYQWFDAPNF